MSVPLRLPARRPVSKRTVRIICAVFVVAGLGMAAWSGWSIAGALGPRTTTPAHIVDLTYSPGGYRSSPAYSEEVAWDGGGATVESEDLYNALYPLEGQPAVAVERSAVTGSVLRVELGGLWYPTADSSIGGAVVVGILWLLWAAFFTLQLARVGSGGPAIRGTTIRLGARPRRVSMVVLGAAGIALGLWLLATGGLDLAALAAPRSTETARVVDVANNYVDLAWDGGTAREVSSDLARDLGIRQHIDAAFGQAPQLTVAIERSSLDGSVLRVEFDDQWYDTAPGLADPVAKSALGLVVLAAIVLVGVNRWRRRQGRRAVGVTSGS